MMIIVRSLASLYGKRRGQYNMVQTWSWYLPVLFKQKLVHEYVLWCDPCRCKYPAIFWHSIWYFVHFIWHSICMTYIPTGFSGGFAWQAGEEKGAIRVLESKDHDLADGEKYACDDSVVLYIYNIILYLNVLDYIVWYFISYCINLYSIVIFELYVY